MITSERVGTTAELRMAGIVLVPADGVQWFEVAV